MTSPLVGPDFKLRQCGGCAAPLVSPVPPGWMFDLVREWPAAGPVRSFVTPHWPECEVPAPVAVPGLSVRVPGPGLSFDLDLPPEPHVFRPFSLRGPDGEDRRADWCGHGAVSDLLTGRGFCGQPASDQAHQGSER